jgi:hypothetical protein
MEHDETNDLLQLARVQLARVQLARATIGKGYKN